MGWRDYWQPTGDQLHLDLIARAMDPVDFDWSLLQPGLRDKVGKDKVPIGWADLSRWSVEDTHEGHVHDGDDTAHVLAARGQVLGLAWYSGMVTLGLYVAQFPDLCAEVLLSEGAHMIDFFAMDDRQRVAVWNAVHGPDQQLPTDTDVEDAVDLGHGHSWFDVGPYGSWVGEAWMGAFVQTYSPFDQTINLHHRLQPGGEDVIRAALDPDEPVPDVQANGDGTVTTGHTDADHSTHGHGPVYGTDGGAVYHDSHDGVEPDVWWDSAAEAEADGRRPCRTCLPHFAS